MNTGNEDDQPLLPIHGDGNGANKSDDLPGQEEETLHEMEERHEHFRKLSEPFRNRIDVSFLQYASYVIRDRAIPRMEDGLKPVQRRILWSLHKNDDGKFIKVANISGYCMQFHPHGDASITDALVVLTNKRYVIEGQGNFGNIHTGDRAAAARYIECRLTPLARAEIFNDELTEVVPSYDGRNKEPVKLPCKLPLLLMLGTEGIAVGLSARILPHNFPELLEAQIAILKKKPFTLLPDFQQGGIMDASDYQDGNGSIKLRAKIEIRKDSSLVIRQIPFGSTTESVINSIEDATRKGKIKIRSIQDYTSENIEIEIKLSPDMEPEKAIQALYAFTDCETSISSRIVVIKADRPVEMTVSELLRDNTERLVDLLKRELELREQQLLDELHFKTLVQIFVENRIYKLIEDCKTQESVNKAIHDGFKPFRDKMMRDLIDKDVEMLLGVHIRRISLFDINRHRKDMERLFAELDQVKKSLSSLTQYAISHIKDLIKTYKPVYPRLTQLDTFEMVAAREVAVKSLTVGFDSQKGYIGHAVSGRDFQVKSSPFDKIVLIWDDGAYRVIPIPDKLYVGKNLIYMGHYDRKTIMTAAYKHKECSYLKRFNLGGAIQGKDYRLCPEKSKVLLIEEGTPEKIYIKYSPKPGQRIHQQEADPSELQVKSAKAKGNQMTVKKIAKISATRPRGWKDEESGPKLAFG